MWKLYRMSQPNEKSLVSEGIFHSSYLAIWIHSSIIFLSLHYQETSLERRRKKRVMLKLWQCLYLESRRFSSLTRSYRRNAEKTEVSYRRRKGYNFSLPSYSSRPLQLHYPEVEIHFKLSHPVYSQQNCTVLSFLLLSYFGVVLV